jgi:hypothetical protein
MGRHDRLAARQPQTPKPPAAQGPISLLGAASKLCGLTARLKDNGQTVLTRQAFAIKMSFRRKMPQTMLRVMMRKAVELHSTEVRHAFTAEARDIQHREGSRQALDYLLGKLPIEIAVDRNEPYCAEALNFHLGLLEAYSGRPEAMAEHIRLSRTMPCGQDEHLFSDHVAICLVARQHQLDAMARKLPPILLTCMPRSASATLAFSLAQLINAPVLHTAIGKFPQYFIAPSWLDVFLQGGAVTQDHFVLNEFNFAVLKARGPLDVFVTIRDPRAAARSQVHWVARMGENNLATLEQRIERECVDNFIPWLQSWIDGSRDPASPLRIHMIKFQDVVSDLSETVRRIARTLQTEFPAMASYAERTEVEEVRIHFKQGDDNAWRSEVGEATRQRLWDACTPDIRELLHLAR